MEIGMFKNIQNSSISLKYFLKATSYINDDIIENNLQSFRYYGTLRRYNWSMPQCGNFMRNLCDVA